MTKRICFLMLLLVVIFWFWVSFANPIAPETHYVCSMFENVEIDNYRVVVQKGSQFYEPNIKECSECEENYRKWLYVLWGSGPTQNVYLLDKSIDIKNITVYNIESNAILIWSITSTFCDILYKDETKLYKVVKSIDGYTMLDRTNHYNVIQEMENKLKQFPIFRFLAIVIETLILFFIAKFFWRKYGIIDEIWWERNEISNKKLLLFWVIPTTITLPLLWFVFPLIIWNEVLYVIIWEFLVVLIESIIIKYWLKISWIKAVAASFVCNLFSFASILPINEFYVHIYYIFLRLGIMPLMLYVLSRIIVLIPIVILLRKNTEISNKSIILVWIFGPILSIMGSALLVFITRYFNLWDWLIFVAIWLYLVLELIILEYWLKVSRKKALIAFMLSILWFVVVYFMISCFRYFTDIIH